MSYVLQKRSESSIEFYAFICHVLCACKKTCSACTVPGNRGRRIYILRLMSPRSLSLCCIYIYLVLNCESHWSGWRVQPLFWIIKSSAWCWPGTILPTGHPQIIGSSAGIGHDRESWKFVMFWCILDHGILGFHMLLDIKWTTECMFKVHLIL